MLAQAAVAIALFADKSWREYLPPDETGEVKRVRLSMLASPTLLDPPLLLAPLLADVNTCLPACGPGVYWALSHC